jgi:hypothetical protein
LATPRSDNETMQAMLVKRGAKDNMGFAAADWSDRLFLGMMLALMKISLRVQVVQNVLNSSLTSEADNG